MDSWNTFTMSKLIALLALLVALAWAVTATASWITAKKAPRALGRGTALPAVGLAEQNRSFRGAQLRTFVAAVFTLVLFATIFRFSMAIAGQAALTAVLTAQLSSSAGLLLFSTLPARKVASGPATAGSPKESPGWTAKRSLPLTLAILLAGAALVTAAGTTAPGYLPWQNGIPALLATAALAGSALLAARRIATTHCLSDPRMGALDQKWRQLALRNLAAFTNGMALAGLGATALLARLTMGDAAAGSAGAWITAAAVAGAALAVAGVVLLAVAIQGTLTLPARMRGETPQRVSA